jgi:hypothetical protein
MDKLNVNTIEPEGATTTLNVGISGKSVIITDNLKANTLKDAGGNTIFTSDGSGNLSSVNSGFGSAQVLLSTQTASGSASLSFTSDIDSTYKEYVFEFITINPDTDGVAFTWNGSTDGGSNYNATKTSTAFLAQHKENDATANLGYQESMDLAQSTDFQMIAQYVGDDADQCVEGELHIFNPSSTTYVKNWFCRVSSSFDQSGSSDPRAQDIYTAGYMNTTSAVNAVQFKMASGNFDGKIKMYGIK